ncbi:MAG: PQQ-binding-like beta-propeller repeat protein [Gammaproteobacteria bacterium]
MFHYHRAGLQLIRVLLLGLLTTGLAQAANPALQDDSVYLAYQGLIRLDLPTLRPRWRVPLEWGQAEPVVSGDTVLLGNSRGLQALSTATGELRWQRRSSSRVFAPGVAGERVYAGSENGHLQALSLSDGSLLWQRQFDGWVYAPAIAANVLIVAGQEPVVRALDPANGATLWEYPLTQEAVHYPVLADARNVIITTFSGTVLALDVATGALRWRVQDSSPNHSPLVSGATLYFRTFEGPVIARAAQDGRELWRSKQALSTHALQLAGESLLAVDEFGAVVVLAQSSGTLIRRYPDPAELLGTPLAMNGRVLFFRDAGGANSWPRLTVIPWSIMTNEENKL